MLFLFNFLRALRASAVISEPCFTGKPEDL